MDKLDIIYDTVVRNERELGEIHGKVNSISEQTAVNTENLKEHMRRTEIAEMRIEKIEEKFTFAWLTKMMATIVAFLGSLGAIVGYLKGWF